jgi:hypothetical protein
MLGMSAGSDFLTRPGFWWGVPLGALATGVVARSSPAGRFAPAMGARPQQERAMLALKAEQEEKMQARKEERENKLREQESLYTAAMDLAVLDRHSRNCGRHQGHFQFHARSVLQPRRSGRPDG